ncbi:MAG: Rieske family ferredoxin [Marinomonas sp.]|jgi:3-phenylpropionate/trans-cinnamate dioxygenase ferredoxin subunit|uniref:MocE family 2Fe-2S type ferredoxin n=1 Tax=Marinomonas communis TaxID=28254 RepID=UPI000C48D40B|nr:MocE family 2Fe-2S type ferredoxin [Marinomonas communis]MAF15152.1 Rieske family ferredoxin [Marinomonas sp.]MCC4273834.1 MocE family 2Fe-2S type ferredoxin [Marinomonas communis]MEC8080476.1 MocE family 2Fe-2S type ferredoxin [Pseudomonadota bacterium]RUM57142.1 MAG: Rieske family ferredoxin [Marinomonas sp.]
MSNWIEVCALDEIDEEDVVPFDHAGHTYAIYRCPEGDVFATSGLCTHERIHLADGLVMDDIIECPKHNGRFNYKNGQAQGAPVCEHLKTFATKVENDTIYIEVAP